MIIVKVAGDQAGKGVLVTDHPAEALAWLATLVDRPDRPGNVEISVLLLPPEAEGQG